MKRTIVNLDELEFTTIVNGQRFSAERAPVSMLIGAKNLGYAAVTLPPGKRAWRVNLTWIRGIFAPNSRWRAQITPAPNPMPRDPRRVDLSAMALT